MEQTPAQQTATTATSVGLVAEGLKAFDTEMMGKAFKGEINPHVQASTSHLIHHATWNRRNRMRWPEIIRFGIPTNFIVVRRPITTCGETHAVGGPIPAALYEGRFRSRLRAMYETRQIDLPNLPLGGGSVVPRQNPVVGPSKAEINLPTADINTGMEVDVAIPYELNIPGVVTKGSDSDDLDDMEDLGAFDPDGGYVQGENPGDNDGVDDDDDDHVDLAGTIDIAALQQDAAATVVQPAYTAPAQVSQVSVKSAKKSGRR